MSGILKIILIVLGIILIVAVCAALAVWFFAGRSQSTDSLLPRSQALADAVYGAALDDFAGAESCEECHQEQYEAWTGSTHAKAGGEPDNETIIAPFDGTPIRFVSATEALIAVFTSGKSTMKIKS